MAKPETREIEKLTAVAWECPFCHRGNGVPEIEVCECGAKLDGLSATKHLAEGGIVKSPVTALVGDKGAESIVPLAAAGTALTPTDED